MTLDDLKSVFMECMKDALIFERDVASGGLLEVDSVTKEGKKWLAVAAGITEEESRTVFSANSARAERATIPLNIPGGGQASLLFVLRPTSLPVNDPSTFARLAHFAPQEGIPLVEIREAYFRLSNLPENDNRLSHLRWELDLATAYQQPIEKWLHSWKDRIQYNPGHAPSHIHFNAPPVDAERLGQHRLDHTGSELRLAVGIPNPLAMILSLAVWIRHQ
ncbi:MAG: hypothetical protein HQ581_24740 [Planctomycetes bacterium]|nr:hypothetical protein [Planctomycetota bacterium]